MHRQSKLQLAYFPLPFLDHRLINILFTEADEAYVIGKRGQYTPVGAYLAGDEIIKIAQEHGVQMIHPGTGQDISQGSNDLIPSQDMVSSPRMRHLLEKSRRLV
jgi:hypothetical protein